MSRQNTMLEERWRVHVVAPDGRATHGSMFKDEVSARSYFTSLSISGSTKILERRTAGASRYRITLQREM